MFEVLFDGKNLVTVAIQATNPKERYAAFTEVEGAYPNAQGFWFQNDERTVLTLKLA